MFVISADSDYVTRKNNQYQTTTDPIRATQYPTEAHAKSALVKLPPYILKRHRNWQITEAEVPKPKVKSDTPQKITLNTMENIMLTYDTLNDILCNYSSYHQALLDELSIIDSEICDIHHYIELKSTQELQSGYNLYSMLRDTLIRRRAVKDKLSAIETINSMTDGAKLTNANNAFHSKSYTPRRLIDLFAADKIPNVSVEEASTNTILKESKPSKSIVEYKGETYTIAQLANKFNIDYKFLYNRITRGMSPEEAVSLPKQPKGRKKVS